MFLAKHNAIEETLRKRKHILQLYTVSLDMDDDGNFHLTLMDKRNHSILTFIDKAYSVVMGKAFSHMMKEIKTRNKDQTI